MHVKRCYVKLGRKRPRRILRRVRRLVLPVLGRFGGCIAGIVRGVGQVNSGYVWIATLADNASGCFQ